MPLTHCKRIHSFCQIIKARYLVSVALVTDTKTPSNETFSLLAQSNQTKKPIQVRKLYIFPPIQMSGHGQMISDQYKVNQYVTDYHLHNRGKH